MAQLSPGDLRRQGGRGSDRDLHPVPLDGGLQRRGEYRVDAHRPTQHVADPGKGDFWIFPAAARAGGGVHKVLVGGVRVRATDRVPIQIVAGAALQLIILVQAGVKAAVGFVPPLAHEEVFHCRGLVQVLLCQFSLQANFLNMRVRHIGGPLGDEDVEAQHVGVIALMVAGDAAVLRKLLRRVENPAGIQQARPGHDLVDAQSPAIDVIRDGAIIEVQEHRIVRVGAVAAPDVHAKTAVEKVEIGGKVVPELGVVLVVHRGRLIEAIDFPVTAPVFRVGDIFGKAPQHVEIAAGQPQGVRPAPGAKYRGCRTPRARLHGFIPRAYRIADIEDVSQGLGLGPTKGVVQAIVGRFELKGRVNAAGPRLHVAGPGDIAANCVIRSRVLRFGSESGHFQEKKRCENKDRESREADGCCWHQALVPRLAGLRR